jgi:hypothetical protein
MSVVTTRARRAINLEVEQAHGESRKRSVLSPIKGRRSSIGFPAVADTENLDCVVAALAENEAPVSDAQAVLRGIETVELLDIAGIGRQKSGQTLEQPQGRLAIDGSDVGPRR